MDAQFGETKSNTGTLFVTEQLITPYQVTAMSIQLYFDVRMILYVGFYTITNKAYLNKCFKIDWKTVRGIDWKTVFSNVSAL